MNIKKLITQLIIIIISLSIGIYIGNRLNVNEVLVQPESTHFEMHMLDVGQGLSLFIRDGDHCMIYDGGDRDHSSYVVSYLKNQGVTSLDYMVASHYDEDHIAGLVGVLHTIPTDTILCPDYETDTDIYSSFIKMVHENGTAVVHPKKGESYVLGTTTIDVLSCNSNTTDENDKSIVLKITHGKINVLITGDASSLVEEKIVEDYQMDIDVFVAGHHGSLYSTSSILLDSIHPSYVLISCGLNNGYGHPHEETLSRIQEIGAKIFRTDLQHEIILYSDGKQYSFNKEPYDGEYKEDMKEEMDYLYVLNINSHLIHNPNCKSVLDMAEHNKEYTSSAIDELISIGYRPCKNCNPK